MSNEMCTYHQAKLYESDLEYPMIADELFPTQNKREC